MCLLTLSPSSLGPQLAKEKAGARPDLHICCIARRLHCRRLPLAYTRLVDRHRGGSDGPRYDRVPEPRSLTVGNPVRPELWGVGLLWLREGGDGGVQYPLAFGAC